MTAYTLQMSSDDCGGLIEYYEYFTACRKVFAIESQRQELSSEFHGVLAVIESNYAEETEKLNKIEKLNEAISERRRVIWDLGVGIMSLFSVPFLIVSGIFGMNNDDLAKDISWYQLMAICGGISAGLLLAFGIVLYFYIIKPGSESKEFYRMRVEEELNIKIQEEDFVSLEEFQEKEANP
eukprot:TRINITY_DN6203_c0_g1_i1.p2 TRINITY_DN6203_c0_g1~~TRINITY_DN6203_c0_g1_i1.p2  ORF type:complete len:181 (-),score=44.12 TRINITY_DN6203_c0_g1_i1:12-554(-)